MPEVTTPRVLVWTLCGKRAPSLDVAIASASRIGETMLVWTSAEMVPPIAVNFAAQWIWTNNFAAARNAALDFAGDTGAEWSAMCDSDEAIVCPDPPAFRAWLAALPAEVEIVACKTLDPHVPYFRERFFRGNIRHRFRGRTHEMIEGIRVAAPPELIHWTELPKNATDLAAKFARDVELLRLDLADDPTNGAAHYYIADTLQALGEHEEAIEHFREHNRLSTWEEARAWSCFKAAECYFLLAQPYRALECAAQGLVHDAGVAELYWIAAKACLAEAERLNASGVDRAKLSEWVDQARCWALGALPHAEGSESERRRTGKRDARALRNGPREILDAIEGARVK